jgi:hypothetical protein
VPSSLYEIEVRGTIGATALVALEGFGVVSTGRGCTAGRGREVDRSALHGVVDQNSEPGLELTAATPVDD